MGICLDTEANTAQETDEMSSEWKGGGNGQRSANLRTPASGSLPMQNLGKVKFDPPKVPVIFVLGGPGSGKVTHCDTLMQEKRGVTHINMMDLLQQYAMGNDMQDFSKLSSKTVTEVLMLEMKMAPAAKAYLVSGYPRSMRDVVEYSEKIQVVNGVILISWRQAVLQKQIDYGAKLGHVVLSLAKMELENFFKNVMPVADYFDQSDMLVAVNGERSPSDVYKDYRTAVLDILNAQENQEALLNGVAGMGRGIDDIPGSIVSVETAPSQNKVIAVAADRHVQTPNRPEIMEVNSVMGQNIRRSSSRNLVHQVQPNQPLKATPPTAKVQTNKCPPVIWVIGGPGSNKATLCLKAVGYHSGWGHISIGRLLRTIADSGPKPLSENYAVKEAITEGEMAPKKAVDKLMSENLLRLNDKKGIIIDGYPRDLLQIEEFEKKYDQKPPIVLLDCSKLQLGRGRLDDTVSSFRRRLELFRELTLPMLKQMDTDARLSIVDGDTDSPSVQREFEKIIRQCVHKLMNGDGSNVDSSNSSSNPVAAAAATAAAATNSYNNISNNKTSSSKNSYNNDKTKLLGNHNSLLHNTNDAVVQDLEEIPNPLPTVSHHVSLTNGHLRNSSTANKNSTPNHIGNSIANNIAAANHIGNNIGNNIKDGWSKVNNKAVGQQNGHIPNGRPNFRNMLEEADNFPIDSHI